MPASRIQATWLVGLTLGALLCVWSPDAAAERVAAAEGTAPSAIAAPSVAAVPVAATPTETTPASLGGEDTSLHEVMPPKRKPGPVRSFIRKQIDQLIGTEASTRELGLLVYPSVVFTPESGWEYGLNSVFVYYANEDPSNRLSEISAFVFLTQRLQYGAEAEHTIYTDKNTWFFYGNVRAHSFPLEYYGAGPDVPLEPIAVYTDKFLRVRERFLRNVDGNLFIGLETDLQWLIGVEWEAEEGVDDFAVPLGGEGHLSVGLGLGIVYDSCHNALNCRHGELAELGFLRYGDRERKYVMNSYFFDARLFREVGDTGVIAAQAAGNFTSGDVPFNQLAILGGARLMRGYYEGHYRDRNAIAGQVEYRWLPIPHLWRFGAAAHASVGSVAPDLKFDKLLWAIGGGVRFLLFPRKDVFTRFDVAWTGNNLGTYIYIGEAF
jgi:hypothetical protein